jgi:putative ABC transport system permease protein
MRRDEQIDKELQFHVDERIADLIASGVTPEEARRRARLEFGGVLQVKEAVRDQNGSHWVETWAQDVRLAMRSLRRTPVFALTAAAILGLGIGANATVFSIVNTVMLRPLPFERADDIVQVRRRTPSGSSFSFAIHDYLALRTQRGALSALAILDVYKTGRYTMLAGDAAESITGLRVSAQFFRVFGISPIRGRLFADGDDVPGRPPTAVITRTFWTRRVAGDPAIVGRALTIAGQMYTVIGVAPDSLEAFSPAGVYLILPLPDASADRANAFQVLARVAPGVVREEAEAQVDVIARQEAAQHRSLTNMPDGIVLRSLQEELVGPIRPALRVLMIAVGFVLLVACSNVANLVLARGLARRRETAVMAALGASRWRIIQRGLAENVLIAASGGGCGLLLAYGSVSLLPALSAARLPQAARIHIDAWVLIFVTIATLVSALLAGLPPALQLSGADPTRWLKQGSAQGDSGIGGDRLRSSLTLVQVALSTMLLLGAGLLARSFWNLATVDPGFRADHVLTMAVSLTPSRYPDSVRLGEYSAAVSAALERIPGIVAASSTPALPTDFPIDFPVTVVGAPSSRSPRASSGDSDLEGWYRSINPHYFAAMGIPVVRGRTFADTDSAAAAPIIIINQALARAAFPKGDAIGQALVIGEGFLTDARDLRPRTIVGIVGDTREQGLRFAPTMTMYLPVAQSPEMVTRLIVDKIPLRWVIRTNRDPASQAAAVRQAVLAVDPTQPATDFLSLNDVLARSIASNRFNTLMLAIFGGVALLLAGIGVYGLTAYAVAQRTREIGIRLSLGAKPGQLRRALVWQAVRLCAIGAVVGMAAASWLARFLRALLFGVGAADALTIAAVASTLMAVVVAATYLLASRAAAIDPMRALRQD